MTVNGTLELSDIDIGSDLDIVDNNQTILAYIIPHFDYESIFHISLDNGDWMDLYAEYRPESNQLELVYYVVQGDKCKAHFCQVSPESHRVIVNAIANKIQQLYGISVNDFMKGSWKNNDVLQ